MMRLSLVLLALLSPSAALAQSPKACAPRTEIVDRLSSAYHEGPVAVGVATNGGILEVLSTDSGSTWTIIVTMPDGVSCLLATGESWRTILEDTEDPAA